MSAMAEFRCPEHGFTQLYGAPDAGDTQPCTICGRTMRRAGAQRSGADWKITVSPDAPCPADPLVLEIADGLARIERNYDREGSGPGSRFEGRLLEDVQAEWVVRMLRGEEAGYG